MAKKIKNMSKGEDVVNAQMVRMEDIVIGGKASKSISTTKETKTTKDFTRPQAKVKINPSYVPLEVVHLIVIHPKKDEGKTYKPIEPSNISASKDVHVVLKHNVVTNKIVNEEDDNINQTTETLNTCEDPLSENIFDKILNGETSSNKLMHETFVEVDPNVICKNVSHDINKNRCEVVVDDESSTERCQSSY
ncbi:unnamed protein product [Vicia faba]|uniref:Uncharacterized protein n=1 Tax=Vicia faba TaxID=3906 RepID=A0AAV0YRW5_VICFA|nr:unnamed protein product [Vicia faba]